jgi:hypothetical protein
VHGIGGLALIGLAATGVMPRESLLSRGAQAPFALMGAAQAVMHQDHPRNAEQAAALRDFATSLPEVAVFSNPSALASPANASRAVSVLTDLISKAETLGRTELKADPAYQQAWQQTATHMGLSLGLDAIDRAIGTLATNPTTASAVPDLRKRLVAARKINAQPTATAH